MHPLNHLERVAAGPIHLSQSYPNLRWKHAMLKYADSLITILTKMDLMLLQEYGYN